MIHLILSRCTIAVTLLTDSCHYYTHYLKYFLMEEGDTSYNVILYLPKKHVAINAEKVLEIIVWQCVLNSQGVS